MIRVLLICNVFTSPKNDFLFAAPYADNFSTVGFETQLLLGIIRNGTQVNFSEKLIFLSYIQIKLQYIFQMVYNLTYLKSSFWHIDWWLCF